MWYWRFVYVHWFKINIWHYSPLLIMLIMLIMLIKKVAQSCRLGNKAEFVHKPIGNMNQSKNLTLLTISRFSGRQLDYSPSLERCHRGYIYHRTFQTGTWQAVQNHNTTWLDENKAWLTNEIWGMYQLTKVTNQQRMSSMVHHSTRHANCIFDLTQASHSPYVMSHPKQIIHNIQSLLSLMWTN